MKMIDIAEFRQRVKTGRHRPQTGIRLAGTQQEPLTAQEGRVVSFVFSDNSVDRYGDTIDARGWVLDNFNANPIALFGHDSTSVENVIGRACNVRIEGHRLVGDIEFMEGSVNATAEAVYQMVKGGYLKTVSVGFQPLEWHLTKDKTRPGGVDFRKQELLEISIVPIPANPNALQQAKAAGIDVDRLGLVTERDGAPLVSKKGLYEVSFLAQLLSDLGYLEDMVEWEAEYEGDNSDIPQRLTDAMKLLGQVLVDMTAEEVGELFAEEDGADPVIVVSDPMLLEGLTTGQKAVHALTRASRLSQLLAGRRFVAKAKKPLTPAAAKHIKDVVEQWKQKDGACLILDPDIDLIVYDDPRRVSFPVLDERAVTAEARSGKVLSSANEKSLRDAHAAITQGCETIKGVLDTATTTGASGDDLASARARRVREAEALKIAAA